MIDCCKIFVKNRNIDPPGTFKLAFFTIFIDSHLYVEREWAVVNGNAKFCRTIRPIEVELCELRSFRLSEDSNQVPT
jgi:hypothetical protein